MPLANERELLRDRNNIQSRNTILEYYIPYVRKMASLLWRYQDDLFWEWMLWLLHAIEMYDETKNNGNFIGYAKYRILVSFYEFLWNVWPLNLPGRIYNAVREYFNGIESFYAKNYRRPSADELQRYLKRSDSKMWSISVLSLWTVSLDGTSNPEAENIGDTLEWPNDMTEDFNNQFIVDIIQDSYKYLSWDEFEILMMRLYNNMTLEQIQQTIWLTRERVRQIEKSDLAKLRQINYGLLWNQNNQVRGIYKLQILI